jgi:predicted glycoside hydrolase/deacetylase ChbG (UPF0249 family)
MRRALRRDGIATPDNFLGDAAQEPYWTIARLRDAVEELPEGVTELMCHPGYSPSAIPSGYSAQREVELRTFTHSSAVALLRRSGVKVANFTVLRG